MKHTIWGVQEKSRELAWRHEKGQQGQLRRSKWRGGFTGGDGSKWKWQSA